MPSARHAAERLVAPGPGAEQVAVGDDDPQGAVRDHDHVRERPHADPARSPGVAAKSRLPSTKADGGPRRDASAEPVEDRRERGVPRLRRRRPDLEQVAGDHQHGAARGGPSRKEDEAGHPRGSPGRGGTSLATRRGRFHGGRPSFTRAGPMPTREAARRRPSRRRRVVPTPTPRYAPPPVQEPVPWESSTASSPLVTTAGARRPETEPRGPLALSRATASAGTGSGGPSPGPAPGVRGPGGVAVLASGTKAKGRSSSAPRRARRRPLWARAARRGRRARDQGP